MKNSHKINLYISGCAASPTKRPYTLNTHHKKRWKTYTVYVNNIIKYLLNQIDLNIFTRIIKIIKKFFFRSYHLLHEYWENIKQICLFDLHRLNFEVSNIATWDFFLPWWFKKSYNFFWAFSIIVSSATKLLMILLRNYEFLQALNAHNWVLK